MMEIGAVRPRRVLGLDYGTERIGVAVSDPLLTIAQGVGTFRNSNTFFVNLLPVIKQYDVRVIVVGMPYRRGGHRGQMAREVERFIQDLRDKTGLEVVEWDERHTSLMAHQTLLTMGVKRKQRQNKARVDEIASALILQSFLDSRKS